ncbi:MoaF-related domain-containing protein [Nocardia sp. NBC_01009]|uniref:MoaF-related domain-containing protein n=1 Tax=Nocardia sp. NBC_01009 TaxID=2975996 RepID=UPI00386D0C81|nr:MoaF N-terminal domain-containing protein [Nocardia sp. NBC_01009]
MTDLAQATAGHPDLIGGPSTTELAGTVIEYRYTTGNHYRMTFTADNLGFVLLSDPNRHAVDAIAYRARKLREDFYLVCWTLKPGIHVALLLDFEQRQVHVTAMMPPNQWEFFDIGEILQAERAS